MKQDFYRSREWERFREVIKAERTNESGDLLCEKCGKVILHKYEAICHHVDEMDLSGRVVDVERAFDKENIQVVCHSCHNKIHERFGFERGEKKVYVVWGPPCSGKSEFVRSACGDRDLIVDLDRLYEALCEGKRGAVSSNVLSVYRSLVDMVRVRNGKWHNAWIVRGLPLAVDRERIVRELGGAELIYVGRTREECLAVARERGGDWVKWVNEWWERYIPPHA